MPVQLLVPAFLDLDLGQTIKRPEALPLAGLTRQLGPEVSVFATDVQPFWQQWANTAEEYFLQKVGPQPKSHGRGQGLLSSHNGLEHH